MAGQIKAVRVPLVGGGIAWIDPTDFCLASEYQWRPGGSDHRYAMSMVNDGPSVRSVYLHRLILAPGPGELVDHVDGDGLNCRRANLRIASASQNAANRSFTNNKNGFRGVSYYPLRRQYQGNVTKGGKFRGPYRSTPEEAAVDVDDLLRGLFGNHATYNFPRPGERGIRRPESSAP